MNLYEVLEDAPSLRRGSYLNISMVYLGSSLFQTLKPKTTGDYQKDLASSFCSPLVFEQSLARKDHGYI